MTPQTREKVLAVERFKNENQVSSVVACKKLKFSIASFYSNRREALGMERLAPSQRKRRGPYTKRNSAPQLMNVTIPASEPSTVSVVVLKGSTEAIREIVTGLGGVFRG